MVMKVIDITTPLIGCRVFGDDTAPTLTTIQTVEQGYKLSDLTMCVHNGTHIDAPAHFLADGGDVYDVAIEKCVGDCLVVRHNGDIDETLVNSLPSCQRVLFDGKCLIVPSGAKALVSRNVVLVGIARLSVANPQYSKEVHEILLNNNVVIVESLLLSHVEVGSYKLVALPLKIKGAEASPIRAVLLQ